MKKKCNEAYMSSIIKKEPKWNCKNDGGIRVKDSLGRLYGKIINKYRTDLKN